MPRRGLLLLLLASAPALAQDGPDVAPAAPAMAPAPLSERLVWERRTGFGRRVAGVAVQLDKPYEIGDWVEVSQGGQTWTGQVEEISWRATTLIGLFDELVVLPNRLMGTSEISNYTARGAPLWRGQNFRIPYVVDLETTKELIARAVAKVEGVHTTPTPYVWIRETTESWMVFRCSYTIDDYAGQYRIGSNVITAAVNALKEAGFTWAANRVQLVGEIAPSRNSPAM